MKKRCSKCKQKLPRNKFSKRSASLDGLNSQCKGCRAKCVRAQYIARHPDAHKLLSYNKNHRTVNGVEQKFCIGCGVWGSVDKFYKNKSRSDGLNTYCKLCVKQISRKHRADKGIPERKRFTFEESFRVVDGIKEKRCTECDNWKSLISFNKNKQGRNGLSSQCKECLGTQQKEYRKVCNSDPIFVSRRRVKALGYYDKKHKTLVGYLRHIFHKINNRCNNPDNDNYELFGGLGIRCLFGNADGFINHVINDLKFDTLEKIGDLLLDRIDKMGDFEPGNIYFVTVGQNGRGHRKQRSSVLGKCSCHLKGVSFDKERNKWKSHIKVHGKSIHLGRFAEAEDAGRAYDRAALKHFGKFALTNFMLGLLDEE